MKINILKITAPIWVTILALLLALADWIATKQSNRKQKPM